MKNPSQEDIWRLYPAFVNLSFSCEIILKLFIKNNSESDYTNEMFISDLKKSENTFAHERYSFEIIPGKSYGLQCDFLLTFSRTLNILAKSLK